jgi:hypothetical protein
MPEVSKSFHPTFTFSAISVDPIDVVVTKMIVPISNTGKIFWPFNLERRETCNNYMYCLYSGK